MIGGLITALFLYVGVIGLNEGSSDVTIKEAPQSEAASGASGGDMSSSVRDVYNHDGPGVVSVDVASSATGPGGGSGFVVDETGHIVTNQHVVGGAEEVSVRFASGDRMDAEIIGEDPSTDVAVIKVEAPEKMLEPLTLGNSESVGVGDPVIAIGNPLNVGISVTTGIVSGTERPIKAPNNFTIDGAVQTDAAINPGNSGGPLLDASGNVIGVNSQILSEDGGFQGVGFAVPIDTVKSVVKDLIENGSVVHGYIGVQMFPEGIDGLMAYTGVSEGELEERYGLPGNGAIVNEVTPDGPADRAGIRGGEEQEIEGIPVPMGDVITEIEGERVSSPDDVIAVVNARDPGDELELTVVTPGEGERQVELTVGTRPDGA